MPKRPNPFVDYAPIQLKMHVGMKEIDCGVRQEELMKDVYEKTRQMLFSGAHKDVNENHVTNFFIQPRASPLATLDSTQARLDSQGHLVTHASSVTHDSPSPNPFKQELSDISLPCFANQGAVGGVPDVRTAALPSGQLCLDSQGQLTAPMDCDMPVNGTGCGVTVGRADCKPQGLARFGFNFKSTRQAAAKAGKAALCQACRRPFSAVPTTQCQFCERGVCVECARQCDRCGYRFCQMCSVLNYDEAMERAFCLNCIN